MTETTSCNSRKIVITSLLICLSAIGFYNYNFFINLGMEVYELLDDLGYFNERLFTETDLAQYNGVGRHKLYLAILGKVYDVTKGAAYYGPGNTYHTFIGRDVSRSFVTGEFTDDKVSDAVLDLSLQDLRSLIHWTEFYDKTYKYKGKLTGRYYDAYGKATQYARELAKRVQEAHTAAAAKETQLQLHPPCNVEWDSEHGTRVWCSTQSGGVIRDWVGVPRKLYEPGSKQSRCTCVDLNNMPHGNLEEYENCASDSYTCYVK